MRRKKWSEKRYHYILWDGIWDSYKEEYCSWYTIEDVMNDSYRQVEVWKKKYDEMKEKYERCKNDKKER
ncbi:MAG: hypothetical protein J6B87_07485 [Clostridia bacterium]|nr:hypothetical protein [Clostridia bacterium]